MNTTTSTPDTVEEPTVRAGVEGDDTPAEAPDPADAGVEVDPAVAPGETSAEATSVSAEQGRELSMADLEDDLAGVVAEISGRGMPYVIAGPRHLQVFVGAGDVVMTLVPLLEEATAPVAILVEGRDAASAVLMRDGDDLFVVRRNPGLWEHFSSPGGPSAIIGSWRSGERTRFRQRHGALWKAVPPAVELAERLGVSDLMPAEVPPPPPAPAPTAGAGTRRAAAPKAPRTPKPLKAKPVPQPEPLPPVCPRCFVQLPASGRCDCA